MVSAKQNVELMEDMDPLDIIAHSYIREVCCISRIVEWGELFVLLFDNYHGITEYCVFFVTCTAVNNTTQLTRPHLTSQLEEAVGLRNVVMGLGGNDLADRSAAREDLGPSHQNAFAGKVTYLLPFNTPDGRGLVAIECAGMD
ncbi:hypothetical protein F5050DRAFT_846059 [Lentinula boryana]|uniref:Uncharacterized protein n=1 Tax=Lentinula boryana TaxID=40481 RepID=A0ABQ8Q383_9AGAR|nr:hypothetical protein F5050DRAFT_846059 [Lentinula boryana]